MDFDDAPDEAAFRAEARAWLEANAKCRPVEDVSDQGRALRPRTEEDDLGHIGGAKVWQRTKADAGWAGIHWPREFGGRGLEPRFASIFAEEEARFDVPAKAFVVGVDMVGPTLIRHASPGLRHRFLTPMLRGEEVWCQLFSEPGAGSDLASVSTRAELDGDEYVVNGQKVWTSGAQYSDWGICLARTDPAAPKHRGISYLLVDMADPGVEVRPLRQMDGAIHFNEVFLTDVRVPASHVVGEVNDGWRVAMTTLTAERSSIGGGGMVEWSDVLALARWAGADEDPVARQRLAELHTRFEILRFLGYRIRTSIQRGEVPGPESSVVKLAVSGFYETAADLVEAMLGPAGMLFGEEAPFGGFFQDLFFAQWAPRIGGGTDQVQRNVIGERVLGLPKG